MKNNYCRWNNIKLIRIPYYKGNNIEEILIKELHLHKKIKYINKNFTQQNNNNHNSNNIQYI